MSMKRQATTELNHDNWDVKEPEVQEQMGVFKTAPQEILEKRVIRTAKRRTLASSDQPKKSVFSGFGGFNKTQTSSFDFLANLTNGNKSNNDVSTKTDTSVKSSLFTSKSLQSSPGGSFEISTTPFKTVFGTGSSPTSSLFGNIGTTGSSIFTSKTADSALNETSFKIQPASSSGNNSNTDVTKVTNVTTIITSPQETSNIFGTTNAITSTSSNSKLTSSTTVSSVFKTQTILNTTMDKEKTVTTALDSEKQKSEAKSDDKKMKYYSKLKGLNESVSDWIKKHVEETPLCILSPIFRDYERYLKEIKAEYENSNEKVSDNKEDKNTLNAIKSTENITTPKTSSVFTSASNSLTGGPSLSKIENSKQSLFAPSIKNIPDQKNSGFSFGIQNSTSTNIPPIAVTSSSGFSFGIKASTHPITVTTTIQSNTPTQLDTSTKLNTTTASPLFSFKTSTTTTTANGSAPFSFGIGKPFSFGNNISNKVENTETKKDEAQDDEDQPPKVEYTPIAEENSVFDKRCKIFVKKDGNFIDKGVGTLYIKKIDNTDKHQLLVRANTSLGNVLLNLRLSSSIPTQKMGKNNVMIVCIPTPDSKPPPTPILIRVKTSEEADELLNILNKYKT